MEHRDVEAPALVPGGPGPNDSADLARRLGKTRFTIYGQEVLEKTVRRSGKGGRVYLPLAWLGKHVKIIRMN